MPFDDYRLENRRRFLQWSAIREKPMTTFRSMIACVLLLAVTAAGPAFGQDVDAAKRAEIEKLLALTGALKLGQQMSSMMVAQLTNVLRASHPDLPQKALDVLPEEINAAIAGNIAVFKEMVIHIYARHYTLEDLQGLTQFYSTPLGRKVLDTLPLVMQESVVAGQKWGASLGPEIGRRLQARFKREDIRL
jgi:uncharacterized protein